MGVSSRFSSSPFPSESGPKEGALDHLCPLTPWKSKERDGMGREEGGKNFNFFKKKKKAKTPHSGSGFWALSLPFPGSGAVTEARL